METLKESVWKWNEPQKQAQIASFNCIDSVQHIYDTHIHQG